MVIGDLRRRLDVAHIKLAASRAFLLVAYFTQSHEILFDEHASGFIVFGGGKALYLRQHENGSRQGGPRQRLHRQRLL